MSYYFSSEGLTTPKLPGTFVALGNNAVYSAGGTSWTAGSGYSATGSPCVCYAAYGPAFYAVGLSAAIYKSTDGVHWSSTGGSSLVSGSGGAIVWSSGLNLFCNVGSGIALSPDAVSWTKTSNTLGFTDVCWSSDKSLFVAVTSGGTLYTSPDGHTWTSRTAPSLAYGGVLWAHNPALFCAVGNGVATSPDGITWTSQTVPGAGANSWQGIAYSATLGLFVAVGNDTSNCLISSPDAVTWTSRMTSAVLTDVCWSDHNACFVATVGSGSSVYVSTDGTTWVNHTVPGAGDNLQRVTSAG